MMNNIEIKGVKNISDIIIQKIKIQRINHVESTKYSLITDGTNLIDLK